MDKIIFISAVRDFEMYDKVIKNNPYIIKDDVILNPINNKINNIGLSKRYNEFLNEYDYSKYAWFVFCHEDWEILESINNKLKKLKKESLYGSFGARIINQRGILIRDYVGNICDCAKEGKNLRRLGSEYENLTKVDTLDCQSLIVHSSLIEKFNLRFDNVLDWDWYVEDFCLNAYVKYNIESKVLNLEICHHSQILDILERPKILEKHPYINEKYREYTFAGITFNIGSNIDNIKKNNFKIRIIDEVDRSRIYSNEVILENDARYIAMNYIKSDKKILDVGCACGDFAIALKGRKKVNIWGMEYNEGSIDLARKTGMFENIYRVDLNNFNQELFKEFYGFFDYIIFGDVLEHINFPQKTLEIFKTFLTTSGEFVLSIPNIAHASIKSNLLLDDFTYTSYGLLDETHVKFFTYKTIPSFLADINLKIEENNVTYKDKFGFQSTDPYSKLPLSVKNYILDDFQSYVVQYVMRVMVSDLTREEIKRINMDKLFINDKNAPKGLIDLRENDLKDISVGLAGIVDLRINLHQIIEQKDQEIRFIKSSKFWKLRELNNKIKFGLFHPMRFVKKYLLKLIKTSKKAKPENFVNYYLYKEYVDFIAKDNNEQSEKFVGLVKDKYKQKSTDPKLISFYLPQFHSIELNDEFYGKGFTEWTNVTKAIPQFTGHYQPHLPIDVGFYDLRNVDVMRRQVELAKIYGIYGFCFHYYWFSGKKLLEKPLLNWLKNKDIDFPFCLCWANENWAKLWDAGDSEILIKQELKDGDDERFMKDILPFLKDKRYIKIDNKPILIIYRPHLFSKERARKLFSNFRKIAKENGFEDLYLITANSHDFNGDPKEWRMDAVVEFPPHGLHNKVNIKIPYGFKNLNFKGTVFDMEAYIKEEKYIYDVDYTLFKTVFPGWDNTARKAYSNASVFEVSPQLYKKWLGGIIKQTKKKNSKSEQFVFINAWNEWAEGAHLEPSNKYGYAYLQATRDVLEEKI